MKTPILKMTNIIKEFPGVKALDGVNLELYEGKVMALMGENGAGKSTLMKILSGVYKKDGGQILSLIHIFMLKKCIIKTFINYLYNENKEGFRWMQYLD